MYYSTYQQRRQHLRRPPRLNWERSASWKTWTCRCVFSEEEQKDLGEKGESRASYRLGRVTVASPSHAACARPTRCARGRLVACARSCDGGEGTGWRCESLSRRLCTPYQRVFVVPPPSPCSAMSVWGISLWSWPCFEYLVPLLNIALLCGT